MEIRTFYYNMPKSSEWRLLIQNGTVVFDFQRPTADQGMPPREGWQWKASGAERRSL
jgi:hypothetical protein